MQEIKQLTKLNKTNLNKLFLKNKSYNNTIILYDGVQLYEVVEVNEEEKKQLVEFIFSEDIFKKLDNYDLIIYSESTDVAICISYKEYVKLYNNKAKQILLYESNLNKEKIEIDVSVGIREKNTNNIEDVLSCKGDKKAILEFINNNNRAYSIKYFFEKTKEFVVNINDSQWLTIDELIENGIATLKR